MNANETISGEDAGILNSVTKIESLCVNCHENGETILLLRRIPHFRDIVISSFLCPHCNYSDREVQAVGSLAPKGIKITLRATRPEDLNRQVVRGEHCSVFVSELSLEVPPSRSKGDLSTVEGLLNQFAGNLSYAAEYQKQEGKVDVAASIDKVVSSLKNMASGCVLPEQSLLQFPVTIIFDDPSGNSYVESLAIDSSAQVVVSKAAKTNTKPVGGSASGFQTFCCQAFGASVPAVSNAKKAQAVVAPAESLVVEYYERSLDQLHAMGHYEVQPDSKVEQPVLETDAPNDGKANKVWNINEPLPEGGKDEASVDDKVIRLPVECPHCGFKTTNNVIEVDIPGFKKCLIFAFVCPHCGAKNSEVRPAGGFGLVAKSWELEVRDQSDLNRDVLKADMASISIPAIEFEVSGGVEGGVFSTIEGLLKGVEERLLQNAAFVTGDSATDEEKAAFKNLIDKFNLMQAADPSVLPFTIIIRDPSDMSFIDKKRCDFTPEEKEQTAEAVQHTREQLYEYRSYSIYRDGDLIRAAEEATRAAMASPHANISDDELKALLDKAEPGELLWQQQVDAELKMLVYKRTEDEEDDLGIRDMDVEDH